MSGAGIPPGPIRGVAAFTTGRVKIHPQHVRGSRLPSLVWILLSPTWGAWRPIHVFVIEHEDGSCIFFVVLYAEERIEDGFMAATANLLAPVVIHWRTRLAVQAIQADSPYSHQHPLLAPAPVAPCL